MIKENLFVAIDFTRKLVKSRYMLRTMAVRELKASYVGSVFGISWAVLNPLVQLVIYGVVFGVFFKSTVDARYGTDSYFLYLLCGLVPWQFFSQTVVATSSSVVGNYNLVKKAVGFPSEILPIVTVVSNIIGHLVSMVILLAVALIFAGGLKATMPVVFLYIFLVSVFSVGLGWILSSLNVFLKDVQQVLSIVTMGWFFFTPIIYSPSIVPPAVMPLMKINPMYHVVEGYRLVIITGEMQPWPELAYLAAVSFATLAVGGVFFRKLKPWFAEAM